MVIIVVPGYINKITFIEHSIGEWLYYNKDMQYFRAYRK